MTIDLELRNHRHRVKIEQISAGPMLASVTGCSPGSFFYRVLRNGSMQCFTPDQERARKVFLTSCQSVGISHKEVAL